MNTSTSQDLVREFHLTFGHAAPENVTKLSMQRLTTRGDYIESELVEFRDAIAEGNYIKAIDALGDIKYFVDGTFVEFGVDGELVTREIHRSNMSKTWPADALISLEPYADHLALFDLTPSTAVALAIGPHVVVQNIATKKVVKGPGYQEPDLKSLFPELV